MKTISSSPDQPRLGRKQQVPEKEGPAVHMQSSTCRWIAAVNDRREIGEPEPGKGDCADNSSDDGIENLASAFLQFGYSSALAQKQNFMIPRTRWFSGQSRLRHWLTLTRIVASLPRFLNESDFSRCSCCSSSRGSYPDYGNNNIESRFCAKLAQKSANGVRIAAISGNRVHNKSKCPISC